MSELEKDPTLELLIYGHSHVAALERSARRRSLRQCGSWLDAPTYLRITPDTIELRSARAGSPEGDCLNSIDRRPQEAAAHP